jgi:hypothetical protein
MGQKEHAGEAVLRENYLFVQNHTDSKFGSIRIYRKQVKPYGFVMVWGLQLKGVTR